MQDEYFSPDNGGGKEPVPDSGVINGLGRYNGGPTNVARAIVTVEQGKRYRLRVINISGFAQFRFMVEGHPLTLIEADGIPHEALTVDSFDIYVAQRCVRSSGATICTEYLCFLRYSAVVSRLLTSWDVTFS